MTHSSRIVRESTVIDYARHEALGPKGVKRLMKEVEAKARAVAKQIGITRPVFRQRFWDLDVTCGFTDYPMYLCGPDAPKIKTAADIFKHVWHLDNPHARYQVVIDDGEILKEMGVDIVG